MQLLAKNKKILELGIRQVSLKKKTCVMPLFLFKFVKI